MNKLIFIPALLITLLTACGTANVYVPPAEGATAKLVLPNINFEYLVVTTTGGGVRVGVKDANGCGTFSKQIKPSDKSNEKTQNITIPGNKDIFVSFSRTIGTASCTVNVSFPAEAGKEYVGNMEVISGSCLPSIKEKTGEAALTPVKLSKAFASAIDGIKVCDAKEKL